MLRDEKKQTKNLFRPQTLDRLQISKSILVLKVHSSNPLTTMVRFKKWESHRRYHLQSSKDPVLNSQELRTVKLKRKNSSFL